MGFQTGQDYTFCNRGIICCRARKDLIWKNNSGKNTYLSMALSDRRFEIQGQLYCYVTENYFLFRRRNWIVIFPFLWLLDFMPTVRKYYNVSSASTYIFFWNQTRICIRGVSSKGDLRNESLWKMFINRWKIHCAGCYYRVFYFVISSRILIL